jgi:ATP-binding cassette subfamily B protein
VFDEATSSLDSLTEQEISATIRDVSTRSDLIAILIAHRLSTVIHADRIFVLERGRIVESGRHQELVELKGFTTPCGASRSANVHYANSK